MMFNPNGCSHDVAWDKHCDKCEELTVRQNIYDLSTDIKAVTASLERMPAMATSPEVIIDLYRTIDRLAKILLRAKS
jgi:hypothetical protein